MERWSWYAHLTLLTGNPGLGAEQRENVDLLLRTRLCQWITIHFGAPPLGPTYFQCCSWEAPPSSSSPASIHSHTETPEANRDPWKVWISLRMKLLKCFICSASDLIIIIALQIKTLFSELGVEVFPEKSGKQQEHQKTDWTRPSRVETGKTTSHHFQKHPPPQIAALKGRLP